jgi:protein-disulfide isomerase
MENIKCPHCHEVFKVDEASFADMLKSAEFLVAYSAMF